MEGMPYDLVPQLPYSTAVDVYKDFFSVWMKQENLMRRVLANKISSSPLKVTPDIYSRSGIDTLASQRKGSMSNQ